MFPDERARNARGLAVGALAMAGVFGLLTLAVGVIVLLRGLHDRNLDSPPSGFGFVGNSNLAVLFFMLWLASMGGVFVSTLAGAFALVQARAGWLRVALYGIVGPAMVVAALWLTQRDGGPGANPWARASSELAEGRGLVAVVVVGLVLMTWLLKPALRRRPLMPPPDPAMRIYSESTT